ncbi:MAG: hypothetical protein GKS00_08970 [Alphaproteobacteria bacterium]|nr:hypothetical protein [Alphaproteobacteria bacterium]
MNTSTTRALVLGSEHPRSAAVLRSLARSGIPVDLADHYEPPTALWQGSRYVRDRMLLDEEPGRAVEMLIRRGKPEGGLLVPTNDHYLIMASRHHEALSKTFTVTVPPWDILGPLMDKVEACRIAREAGLEVPHHYRPSNAEELDRILADLDFEDRAYVLKIRMWDTGAADAQTLRRVAQAGSDAATLRAKCEAIRESTGEYPLIEEVVPGTADRCIGVSMIVDKNHEPVVAYCARRLKLQLYAKGDFKHPYELGANAYCESMHDPEAIELATRFVRHARFTGAITVELKRDAIDSRLKFIKADCRFVRATGLSTSIGLDMPTALYRIYTGVNTELPPQKTYPAGVNWIWLEAYAYSLWKNRRNISLTREVWDLLKRLRKVRSWAYFDWRDPLPSIILALTVRRRLKLLESAGTRTATPGGKMERSVSG